MAKKENKVAEVKVAEEIKAEVKKVVKLDLKELSSEVEKHFTNNKVVDVIADTRLDNPTALTYDDYKFLHFYKKGTTKDLFQGYLGKTCTFIIRTSVSEFLGEDVVTKEIHKKVKGEDKVIHIEVKCPIDTVNEVAEKIIEACQQRDTVAAQVKEEKAKEQKAKKEKTTTKKSKKEQVA